MPKADTPGRRYRRQMKHFHRGVEMTDPESVMPNNFHHQVWKKPPFYYEPRKFLEVVFKRRSAQI